MEDKILINASSLLEELSCAVCMGDINDCYTTPCSHNFCYNCIDEWLSRNKSCPTCKTDCNKDIIMKNYTLDSLKQKINTAKEQATKDYFNISTSVSASDITILPFNPIREVFQRHVIASLIEAQLQYDSLRKLYENKRRETSGEKDIIALDKGFEDGVSILVKEYDAFLTKSLPSIQSIKTNITIMIPSIDFKGTYALSLTSTLDTLIRDTIQLISNTKKVPAEKIIFVSSDVKTLAYVTVEGKEMIIELNLENGSIYKQLPTGSLYQDLIIEFNGLISIQSKCFIDTWIKDGNLKMNYYRCDTCNLNWICEACAIEGSCHLHHKIRIAVRDHIPTYACCYCNKKHICKLITS